MIPIEDLDSVTKSIRALLWNEGTDYFAVRALVERVRSPHLSKMMDSLSTAFASLGVSATSLYHNHETLRYSAGTYRRI